MMFGLRGVKDKQELAGAGGKQMLMLLARQSKEPVHKPGETV
jgi:hypothetical protein